MNETYTPNLVLCLTWLDVTKYRPPFDFEPCIRMAKLPLITFLFILDRYRQREEALKLEEHVTRVEDDERVNAGKFSAWDAIPGGRFIPTSGVDSTSDSFVSIPY
jgi:hypothetical protein